MRWVTRERPKIDRIACPWLVARFVDPEPEFLYVPAARVLAVAGETGAIPYDVPGVELGHDGPACSFDAFLAKYRLDDPALRRIATIVRGADTCRHDLAPECAGLFAVSVGLSALFADDHEMLRHGMVVYDALHAWAKDCRDETHDWPPAARARPGTPAGKEGTVPYTMKPLACDPQHVKGMSERLIISHYENNYGGAVKRLNLLEEQLAGLDFATAPTFVVNGLKREPLVAMNSVILHELFFENLGEAGEPAPALREALDRDFGSFERWRAEFVAVGKALAGGSGWVLLSRSPRDGRLVNQWASDHAHTLAGGRPILALDMYEHSYHLDYGAKAAGYVDAFMEAVDWTAVYRRHAALGPEPA